MTDVRLRTPEEISDDLDGKLKVATIRRHCREGNVSYIQGDRGKFLLTDEQVKALLAFLSRPAKEQVERATESPFGATKRSQSSRRRV